MLYLNFGLYYLLLSTKTQICRCHFALPLRLFLIFGPSYWLSGGHNLCLVKLNFGLYYLLLSTKTQICRCHFALPLRLFLIFGPSYWLSGGHNLCLVKQWSVVYYKQECAGLITAEVINSKDIILLRKAFASLALLPTD